VTASVVIPTRNRQSTLLPLLERILGQSAAHRAEVIVVDNGSTDGTRAALRPLEARYADQLACIVEAEPGATRARNAGARAARGDVIAFVDDDALPDDIWLPALLAPFDNVSVAAVGGRVRLRFAGPQPSWWDGALADYLAAYDLGPEAIDLATRPWYDAPRALNMAVRRAPFLAVGGFDPRLGPRADRPSVGEESDLCLRLLARGAEVRYVPAAVVEHLVDPARLRPEWFFRRAFWTGWSEAMIDVAHRRLHHVGGRIRWHYRQRALRLPYRPRGEPDAGRLRAECERREAWGYLLGILRHAPTRRWLGASAVRP
jgi:glycosyltransferase involved in cell wall biosynthesis